MSLSNHYHSDHLGSTSYITDKDGNITQYDAYLPYGELLVDEHSSSEDLPYKFNGKELDEETGLYYYGARYMQPVASIWYGVDPLAEKYTEISGYVYCHANPIRLVDPDGQGDYYAQDGTYLANDKKNDNLIYVQYSKGNTSYSINGVNTKFQKLNITKNVFLAFASAINTESSGIREETMALGNVVVNYIKNGGSKNIKTLEDVVLFSNSFMRGAKQKDYTEFCSYNHKKQNLKFAIEGAINAVAYNQGLSGFYDYSRGANTWDGIDLMFTKYPNTHTGYTWDSVSKNMLIKYKSLTEGNVNVNGFKYSDDKKRINIKATAIIGKTLFTKLYGGRGERKSGSRFK